MNLRALTAGVIAIAATVAFTNSTAVFGIGTKVPVSPAKPPVPKPISIDLDKSIPLTLPKFGADLKPHKFTTKDGKQGWALRITGGRPIATPAYEDGLIFVGGGYGSHEFYAFNAITGALAWKINTGDDGPTAAVVENGYVAFNTESCTVYCVEAKTGKTVWQEWLGDPLMSQPAMADGRLYMAYPANNPRQQPVNSSLMNKVNHVGQNIVQTITTLPQHSTPVSTNPNPPGYTHRILCAEVKAGKHLWDQPITGDIISAPVIDGNDVLFTCFDGTSFSMNARTGKLNWKKKNGGTSAPLVVGQQIVVTEKENRADGPAESMRRLEKSGGTATHKTPLLQKKAQYLTASAGGGVAIPKAMVQSLDASVGFSTAPGAAQLGTASSNVGVSTVAGAWAYQGSRAAYRNGQIMNAQGRNLHSVNASDGKVAWEADIKGKDISSNEQVFSPPALGEQNMYLCSSRGHVVSLKQKDGSVNFSYSTGQPITFQPALANGNIYAGTTNGLLFCLQTGSADATGWTSWGGNAQHNKVK